jgi:Lrp/AsnC family leucine-responsive transcriptional regulator
VVQPKDYSRFEKPIETMDEVRACDHVTGEESFVLRAAVADVLALESPIKKLTLFGPTKTSVILSAAPDRRSLLAAQKFDTTKN